MQATFGSFLKDIGEQMLKAERASMGEAAREP